MLSSITQGRTKSSFPQPFGLPVRPKEQQQKGEGFAAKVTQVHYVGLAARGFRRLVAKEEKPVPKEIPKIKPVFKRSKAFEEALARQEIARSSGAIEVPPGSVDFYLATIRKNADLPVGNCRLGDLEDAMLPMNDDEDDQKLPSRALRRLGMRLVQELVEKQDELTLQELNIESKVELSELVKKKKPAIKKNMFPQLVGWLTAVKAKNKIVKTSYLRECTMQQITAEFREVRSAYSEEVKDRIASKDSSLS